MAGWDKLVDWSPRTYYLVIVAPGVYGRNIDFVGRYVVPLSRDCHRRRWSVILFVSLFTHANLGWDYLDT